AAARRFVFEAVERTMLMPPKSSKHQLPSSREAPKIKPQLITTRPFGAWGLELLLILNLGSWIFTPLPAFSADQPQWGQAWSRNMISPERGLPDSFAPKTGQNIKWSAELGTETHS